MRNLHFLFGFMRKRQKKEEEGERELVNLCFQNVFKGKKHISVCCGQVIGT
jgi:hypothetical protein